MNSYERKGRALADIITRGYTVLITSRNTIAVQENKDPVIGPNPSNVLEWILYGDHR